MPTTDQGKLVRIDKYRWVIPATYKAGMRVPGLIFSDEKMIRHIQQEQSLEQVANVAFLPGIVGYSLAMPDIHWGYGFPIGGVAATRVSDGVISPGGVGFDINCGVRLLRTNLTETEVTPKIEALLSDLFVNIPSGLGSEGKIKLKGKQLDKLLAKGASWAVAAGYGEAEDLDLAGVCARGEILREPGLEVGGVPLPLLVDDPRLVHHLGPPDGVVLPPEGHEGHREGGDVPLVLHRHVAGDGLSRDECGLRKLDVDDAGPEDWVIPRE